MFTSILLLISVLQWSAKSAVLLQLPNQKCITESGKIYTNGSVFTDNECTTKCECLDDGIISCQPMCSVTKNDHFCARLQVVYTPVGLPDSQGRSCSCPSFICEPGFCSDGGKTYKPGDRFISADCSSSCVCHAGGIVSCVSLCPPTIVQCDVDEEKIQFSRKIGNSDCTCPDWNCVKVLKPAVQDQLPAIANQPRKIKKQQCMSSNGKIYAVGQEFTDINCSSRCQCKEDGIVTCTPLCMVLPKDSFCAKQNVVDMPIKLPDAEGRSCSCPLIMCEGHEVKEQVLQINVNEFCYDGENKYKPGDHYITANCGGSCVCGPGGSVSCVSLCPPRGIRCAVDEEKIEFSRKIAKNCTCLESKCVTKETRDVRSGPEISVCINGGQVYNSGDVFISTNCTSRCVCISGYIECEELCPFTDIICKPGEMKKQWSKQIPGSKCSCSEYKCVKKPDEFCEIFGERHKIGEFFIPKDCSGYCRCRGPTSVGCSSLCPPHGIYCLPGTRKVRTVRPVGRHCTCPSWKCVKIENMWRPWSNWTECDAECGGGLRFRFRTCVKNKKCFGPRVETKVCNVAPCSPSYIDAPCGAMRINSAEGDIWPRCDDQGYFEPLQCDPIRSECWCVDKWGNLEPGSRRISQKPQCRNSDDLQGSSKP